MNAATERIIDAARRHGAEPKPRGREHRALCPCHDDHDPSVSINDGAGGRALVKCRTCGRERTRDILESWGLTMAALFSEPGDPAPRQPNGQAPKVPKAYASVDEAVNAARRSVAAERRVPVSQVRVTATWIYHAAGGAEAMRVVRFDSAAGKDFRPLRPVAGGWALGDPPGPLPLYGLHDLPPDLAEPVALVEGEKCRDALHALGIPAVTSAHGAQCAGKSDWTPLAGRTVHTMPDHDDAGRAYVEAAAGILWTLEPPAVVRIVDLPGLLGGQDVADLIADRRADAKDDDAIRQELADLAAAAPEWKPPEPNEDRPATTDLAPATSTATLQPFANGRQAYHELRGIRDDLGRWNDHAGRIAERVADWFSRRGSDLLTMPSGKRPNEPISYAASVVGCSVPRLYQLRDWGICRKLRDSLPVVEGLTERACRPLSRLLAAGRTDDISKALDRARELFDDRVTAAEERAARSKWKRIPKAITGNDVQAAVAEILPPEPKPAAQSAKPASPGRSPLLDMADFVARALGIGQTIPSLLPEGALRDLGSLNRRLREAARPQAPESLLSPQRPLAAVEDLL